MGNLITRGGDFHTADKLIPLPKKDERESPKELTAN
jgi:hypothetical protein